MLKKKTLWVVAAPAIVALLTGAYAVWGDTMRDTTRPTFPHSQLVLTRSDGQKFIYDVEVARDEHEQAYGLMYVKNMAENAGMIFPYDPPREVAFWMKNTFIPLDLLFIDADHRIGRLSTNARPMDVTPIVSGLPVSSVIELNTGQVDHNKFAVGDRVDYAAWSNP